MDDPDTGFSIYKIHNSLCIREFKSKIIMILSSDWCDSYSILYNQMKGREVNRVDRFT
jgi:hypothetical protein